MLFCLHLKWCIAPIKYRALITTLFVKYGLRFNIIFQAGQKCGIYYSAKIFTPHKAFKTSKRRHWSVAKRVIGGELVVVLDNQNWRHLWFRLVQVKKKNNYVSSSAKIHATAHVTSTAATTVANAATPGVVHSEKIIRKNGCNIVHILNDVISW